MADQHINHRKIEHINIVRSDLTVDRNKNYWDQIFLKHRALPETNFASIDTGTTFLGKHCKIPLIISSMTGGDHQVIKRINQNLANAAERTGIAMAVGSQRVIFENKTAEDSFRLRPFAPSIPLLANLGAVQLNYGFSDKECRHAVDVLGADALYFHLNPLQEVIQPEGDCNFFRLAEKIESINNQLDVPVILKEVGAGFSEMDAQLAIKHGIRYIDVAGSGGISWSRIEHQRQKAGDLGLLLQDWGIPTPVSLQLLNQFSELTLIASGGIRTGIDMAKALILGASMCGIAGPLLQPAIESADKVVQVIHRIEKEFRTVMFLLGAEKVADIYKKSDLLMEART